MHLLGVCSEPIRFWATLAQLWPFSGQKRLKMGRNGGLRSLSGKLFTKSNSTLIEWMFSIGLLSNHIGHILALWWPHNDWKWWFPNIIWKIFALSSSNFGGLGECSECVRFWATLDKFKPSSGHKMTEIGGFQPLSGKVFTQSNLGVLGECSECVRFWRFWATLDKFRPSSGHKLTDNGGFQPLS